VTLSDDSPPSSSFDAAPPFTASPSESLEAALARQDWNDLSSRLTKYAHFRLRKSSWETAEEIAQEAIAHLLDAAYAAWDRARHPDLFDCLGHLVNGIVANHFRLARVRAKYVPLRDDAAVHDDELPEPGEARATTATTSKFGDTSENESEAESALPPREDGVLLRDERAPDAVVGRSEDSREQRAITALRARLAGDTLALGVLDQIQSGVGSAAAQAKALRVTVPEVYTAKRRVMHHVRRLARDLAEGDES
jgi:hypothetical protein